MDIYLGTVDVFGYFKGTWVTISGIVFVKMLGNE